jgi:hypothetical protein
LTSGEGSEQWPSPGHTVYGMQGVSSTARAQSLNQNPLQRNDLHPGLLAAGGEASASRLAQ